MGPGVSKTESRADFSSGMQERRSELSKGLVSKSGEREREPERVKQNQRAPNRVRESQTESERVR